MKILSFIEAPELIEKILKHLGLWEVKPRPPPKATRPTKIAEYSIDYSTSQIPALARRQSGGSDKWLYVDLDYPEILPAPGPHSTPASCAHNILRPDFA